MCGAMLLKVEVVVKPNNGRLIDRQKSWQMACAQRIYYIRMLLPEKGKEGELTFMESLCPGASSYVLPHIRRIGTEGKNNF